ncbi:MAG: hypothetical protein DSM107014_16620 [Gomphosphaeria aponina SAG 52.96 = DSM 107014]|uniref:Uncharacterized protein n=1 Tax=Gomphosphaeria aponina SAG 52.96 = DSM 107014 TaxID=1521640 RepID=A0A941GTE9_9CHRO|nr:hypothetical protein [Gomphosphaeria aponina SAG 52.96 = DSM 107014]
MKQPCPCQGRVGGVNTTFAKGLVDGGEFVVEADESHNSNTGDSLDKHEIADIFGVYYDVIEEPLFAGNSFEIAFVF